jgi:cadmium resistance protein CadD (predicted permease)
MLTYTVIAMLAIASLLSLPETSFYLEIYMNRAIGPLLIVVGIILLDVIPLSFSMSCVTGTIQTRAGKWGTWGAGLLGILFALTFCPVSAALFFGSLIPLAIKSNSSVLLPSLYGFGTGLPVFIFAVLIALGVKSIGRVFDRLSQLEKWARKLTAVVFVGVGIYLSLKNLFGLL